MSEEIKVHVIKEKDRANLVMRYVDPATGKQVKRSAKTPKMKIARDRAAVWEHELRTGKYVAPSKLPWADFRSRYESEVVPGLAEKTGKMITTAFNAVERITSPKKLSDMTAARLSAFQAKLRKEQRSESTIRSYLAHLRSALRWAVDVGMLPAVPKFPRLKRAKGSKVMKGRPITTEEFERMLAKVVVVLTETPNKQRKEAKPPSPEAVESWKRLLTGLWWSGLRLNEALNLYWDRTGSLSVDLSGRRPMLRIPAELEKGNKERLLPIAPEFAKFLLATPEDQRIGLVFKLVGIRGKVGKMGLEYVSAVIAKIGKLAGVKVNTKRKTDPDTGKSWEVAKFASAHDLRRSFGDRWSRRIMPPDLMVLMRHEDIQTTMRYYVGRNAQTTADTLWAAYEADQGQEGTVLGTVCDFEETDKEEDLA